MSQLPTTDRSTPGRGGDGLRLAQVVMRTGLVSAFTAMLVGAILHLAEGGSAGAVTYGEMLSGATAGDRVMMAGTLLLAATPVAQVLVLATAWWRQGDRRYAAVAMTVLAVLAVGAALGGA